MLAMACLWVTGCESSIFFFYFSVFSVFATMSMYYILKINILF